MGAGLGQTLAVSTAVEAPGKPEPPEEPEHKPPLRARTFGPASEEPFRRRTSDGVRVALALVLFVLLARHHDHITTVEQNIFELFNSLPGGLKAFFRLLYGLGALWAVGLVFAAAIVARRVRLARDLLLSGLVAWGLARFIGSEVVDRIGLSAGLHAVVRLGHRTPNFPFTRLAVVVAIICAASPYLTLPSRRIGRTLVVALALSALYLGTALPNDILGGLVLGWGIAASVHLVFRSPGGRPTTVQVAACLAQLDVPAHDVRLAPRQPPNATLMLCDDDRGRLVLKVIGRDEADAQFLSKLWRFLFYKDRSASLYWTRLQQVEHEAYTALRARDRGVNVPEVVVAATAGPGTALLVLRALEGTLLAELDPTAITDDLLVAVWQQVARLHEANMAHGNLNAHHIFVTSDGPALVDFSATSATNVVDRRPDDIAELLASTAALIDEDRAVAAAVQGIGAQALVPALPLLQPAALNRETRLAGGHRRREFRSRLKRVAELAAEAAGTDVPPLQELHRVKATNVLMAVGMFVAAAALLSEVGDPSLLWHTVETADWGWLTLALFLSLSTNVTFAIGLMGTVPIRLPLARTSELQLSMSFANLAVPAVGGMAAQIRFLQKQGADLASAVASGGLLANVAGPIAQLVILVIALALTPDEVNFLDVPTGSIADFVLLAALVICVIAGVVFGVPRIRRAAMPPIRQAASTLWSALRSPRNLALLVGGNAATAVLFGWCLFACIQAFGTSPSIWTLLVVNIGVTTVASLVPIPGGTTAVSTVGVSGALTAFGVPTEVAVSAVLANQLVVNYVPAIFGWFATKDLLDHDYL